MNKLFMYILLVSILIISGCGKNYKVEQKEGYKLIENTVEKPKLVESKVVDEFKLKNRALFTPFFKNNKIFSLYRKKNIKNWFIGLFNRKLELIKRKKLSKGKGPAEVLSVCAVSFFDKKFYIADRSKMSFEIFDKNFKYYDSLIMKDINRMYRFPSEMIVNKNGIYFSPTIPYPVIKINKTGEITGYIESEKNIRENSDIIWNWNAAKITDDKSGNIYVTFYTRGKIYEIRKYDKDMNLIWKNKIKDKYEEILKSRRIKQPDGNNQPAGCWKVNDIDVYKDKIYLLRGVGGKKIWINNNKESKTVPINDIEYSFIDVFDKENGRYLYKIKADFLNTKLSYRFNIYKDKFYFFSKHFFNEDGKENKNSNKLVVAEIEK